MTKWEKKIENAWVEDQRRLPKNAWLEDTSDEDRTAWENSCRQKFNVRHHPYWKTHLHPLEELVVVEEQVLTPARCSDFDGDEKKCKTAAFAWDEEESSCQYIGHTFGFESFGKMKYKKSGMCTPRPPTEREKRWREKQKEVDETCIDQTDVFGTKSRFTGNWEKEADYLDPETTVVVYTPLFENAAGEQKGTCFDRESLTQWIESQKPQYEWIPREGMEQEQYGNVGSYGIEFEYDENKQTESNFIGYLENLGKPYIQGPKFFQLPVWAGKDAGQHEDEESTWSRSKAQYELWIDEVTADVLLHTDKPVELEETRKLRLGGKGYGESGSHGQYIRQIWGSAQAVNLQDSDGNTTLILAALSGHLEVVDKLLQKEGIEVNLQNKNGNTALMIAAFSGHLEVVYKLLEKEEIEVNLQNKMGNTALILAALKGHSEVVYKLLQIEEQFFSGLFLNLQNIDGNTALIVAAQEGYSEIVDSLLQKEEIEVNLQNKNGNTALILAAQEGYSEIVDSLLEGKETMVDLQNNYDRTALMLAAFSGHLEIVNRLLLEKEIDVNLQNIDGDTALMFAVQFGYSEIVNSLLQKEEISVNLQALDGNTALILAAQEGFSEIVNSLLQKEIDVDFQDFAGTTALMGAAFSGHLEVVDKLLQKEEIDVNLQNKSGNTALMFAALNGYLEVVNRLLQKDEIDVNLRNQDRATALMLAESRGHDAISLNLALG